MLRFVPRDALPPAPEDLAALRPHTGVTARLLFSRGVRTAEEAQRFLHPCVEQLHDPMLMHGMAQALDILHQAKTENIPAVVYGDYDVDGMCAASLACDALRRFGIAAQPHIPLREEGYGLNLAAVEKLSAEFKLLITVDLGVTNHAEVRRAQELGMTVIVTDHHQLSLEESPADALITPLKDEYPCPRLCGTGVAFKLAQALLGLPEAMRYLDLAALATVADLVPLTGENRVLVSLGLPILNEGRRQGIRALLAVSGCVNKVDSDTLGFQLGPRLNAAGRLADANMGVRLLMSEDALEADQLARELDSLNARRKGMEAELLARAEEQAKGCDFVSDRALIVRGEGWPVGVIGLAAGRLCQKYYCPTVVLSEEDGVLHGSLRSIPGVNIHQCLLACDDLLLRYGGHEQAAGVTLAADQYTAFCNRLQQAVRKSALEETFLPAQPYDAEIKLGECTDALADDLECLAPFGFGNPAPLFYVRGAKVERRRACGAQGAHLQLAIRDGSRVMDGIAFGMGAQASRMPQQIDAAICLKRDTFRGVTTLKCEMKAYAPADGAKEHAILAEEESGFASALLDTLNLFSAGGQKEGKATESLEIKTVTDASPREGGRGTLYVARTRETALTFVRKYPAELMWGMAEDPRCFDALLLLPDPARTAPGWRRVVLLDGLVAPEEVSAWKTALPNAAIEAFPVSSALHALLAEIDAGDDAYRTLYRALRSQVIGSVEQAARQAGLTPVQALCGFRAFAELGFISFCEAPFSYAMNRAEPKKLDESPLIACLRAVRNGKEV